MAYLRWSYSNWYVYWTFDGKDIVQVWHVDGSDAKYDFNSDIDEFIKQEFNDKSESDKKELKEALIEANEDYNNQEEQ